MINRVALVLTLLTCPALAAPPAKPNVLFIAVDDLRDWVGYLKQNPQTKTPNIDRLAARGVAFTRSYCAAPVCNPSRAALMSGLRPSTSGVYDNNNDWRTVIPPERMLTTTFRNAGYYVAGAGKIYHGSYDRTSEYDDYSHGGGAGKGKKAAPEAKKIVGDSEGVGGIRFAPLAGGDDALPDYRIASYVIDQLGKTHDKPFFLACGLHKPHMPWNVPQKYFDLFPLESIQLPPTLKDDLADLPPAGVRFAKPQGDHAKMVESGRWKEAVRAYLASIAYTDMNVGRVLDALDKSPHKDNTIVVFWGDHGWHLGEKEHWRKFALWEESTRSPLIVVAPGVTKAGGVSGRTVDFMSIYPTLCDLAGIAIPKHVEGPSLKPLLQDPAAEWAHAAVTTHTFNNHAVRTEQFRYIRYANGDEELYDHAADPNEWKNLAGDLKYVDMKAKLAAQLPKVNRKGIGNTAKAED
ncbi:MAG TPA: sulfatase [Tepidisphaeraceae bacterium]|nr:sulfatase [Tepidisphaeraceae bacterium]